MGATGHPAPGRHLPEPDLTAGEANALWTARDYPCWSAFSRTGLIEQLELECYTGDQAEYVVTQAGL